MISEIYFRLQGLEMKITRKQLRKIIREAIGPRITHGALKYAEPISGERNLQTGDASIVYKMPYNRRHLTRPHELQIPPVPPELVDTDIDRDAAQQIADMRKADPDSHTADELYASLVDLDDRYDERARGGFALDETLPKNYKEDLAYYESMQDEYKENSAGLMIARLMIGAEQAAELEDGSARMFGGGFYESEFADLLEKYKFLYTGIDREAKDPKTGRKMAVGTAGYKKDIENFIDELYDYLKKYQSKWDTGGDYTDIVNILRDKLIGQ